MKPTTVNREERKKQRSKTEEKKKKESRENHGNQSWFLETIIKINWISYQADKKNKKREGIQTINIKNVGGGITIDSTDVKRIWGLFLVSNV